MMIGLGLIDVSSGTNTSKLAKAPVSWFTYLTPFPSIFAIAWEILAAQHILKNMSMGPAVLKVENP